MVINTHTRPYCFTKWSFCPVFDNTFYIPINIFIQTVTAIYLYPTN